MNCSLLYIVSTFRYPDYKFLGDPRVSKDAAVRSRYNKVGLTGVICDIAVLSKCDYLVGTFSSQVSLKISGVPVKHVILCLHEKLNSFVLEALSDCWLRLVNDQTECTVHPK